MSFEDKQLVQILGKLTDAGVLQRSRDKWSPAKDFDLLVRSKILHKFKLPKHGSGQEIVLDSIVESLGEYGVLSDEPTLEDAIMVNVVLSFAKDDLFAALIQIKEEKQC